MKQETRNKRRRSLSTFSAGGGPASGWYFLLSTRQGLGLIEVVVSVSIITASILGIVGAYSLYVKTVLSNTERLQSTFLAEEGIEAIRYLRDNNWADTLGSWSSSNVYYLVFSGGEWEATTAPQAYIDGKFLRSFVMGDVFRDTNDDIAVSGTLDPGTKLITVNVEWATGNSTTTKSSQVYFSDIF